MYTINRSIDDRHLPYIYNLRNLALDWTHCHWHRCTFHNILRTLEWSMRCPFNFHLFHIQAWIICFTLANRLLLNFFFFPTLSFCLLHNGHNERETAQAQAHHRFYLTLHSECAQFFFLFFFVCGLWRISSKNSTM